jgi:hypothetical protein
MTLNLGTWLEQVKLREVWIKDWSDGGIWKKVWKGTVVGAQVGGRAGEECSCYCTFDYFQGLFCCQELFVAISSYFPSTCYAIM